MRGKADTQMTMLSLVTADQLVPEDHPIRQTKPIVNEALHELSPVFNRMYAETGWPSIPPEHLLKACLLIALYSVRSERQFCERLQSQSGDTRRPCDYGMTFSPTQASGYHNNQPTAFRIYFTPFAASGGVLNPKRQIKVTEGGVIASKLVLPKGGMVTRRSIEEYADAVRPRYQWDSKKTKTIILNELVANTGLHRKVTLRLLKSGPLTDDKERRLARPCM